MKEQQQKLAFIISEEFAVIFTFGSFVSIIFPLSACYLVRASLVVMGSLLSRYSHSFQQRSCHSVSMGLSQWPCLSSCVGFWWSGFLTVFCPSPHRLRICFSFPSLKLKIFTCTLRWQGLLSFPSALRLSLLRGEKSLKRTFCFSHCAGCSPIMGWDLGRSFLCLLPFPPILLMSFWLIPTEKILWVGVNSPCVYGLQRFYTLTLPYIGL